MWPSSASIPPLKEQPYTSSPHSPNLSLWASDDETDCSYDSSQLQPSPSIMSASIPEGPTTFRITSASSVNKPSTLPVSSSILTTRTSSHRRGASISLRTSSSPSSPAFQLSSSESAETTSSSSSSFSDGFSSPSSSSSSLVLLPLPTEMGIDEESVVGRAPRTVSTLLDTAYASVRSSPRSPPPIPIPPRTGRTHTIMPERRTVTNVSTPYGSGGTEQANISLRTVSEKPLPPTPRNFAPELDRLAEDLRGFNNARGQESKEIADNIKTLRDGLQGLSAYARSTRTHPNVVTIVERPIAPSSRPMEARSVGGSTEITPLHYSSPEEVTESVGGPRPSSRTTSVESFLSSHHSDDSSLYEYHSTSPVSPISDTETEDEDESSFVSSSEVTQSEASEAIPVIPAQIVPSILPIPPPEILPTLSGRRRSPPAHTAPSVPLVSVDRMVPIIAIMDQLDNLAKSQTATVRKIDTLRAPEYPEIPVMHHKIDRVEDLVRDLIQKFENRPPRPVVVPVPIHQPTLVPPESRPPSQAATIHDQLP